MDYFIYNGIDSRDLGVYLINDGINKYNFMHPKEIYTTENMNTDGTLVSHQNFAKSKISLRFKVNDYTPSTKNLIASWLGSLGEGELILSTELHKKYIGVFEAQADVSEHLNFGTSGLDFILYDPIAKSRFTTEDIINNGIVYDSQYLYDSGLLYDSNFSYKFENITTEQNMEIYNGSTVRGSRPKIVINGSADNITIEKYNSSDLIDVVNSISYSSFSGELIFDCENGATLLDGSLVNNPISGEYFSLETDDFTRIIRGNIVDSTNNTITLGQEASDQDDYYNGYHIAVEKSTDNNTAWYKIVDYNGLTRTITTESTINTAIEERFTIYDVSGSVNNFKISGTNLNITSIEFKFEFLY